MDTRRAGAGGEAKIGGLSPQSHARLQAVAVCAEADRPADQDACSQPAIHPASGKPAGPVTYYRYRAEYISDANWHGDNSGHRLSQQRHAGRPTAEPERRPVAGSSASYTDRGARCHTHPRAKRGGTIATL